MPPRPQGAKGGFGDQVRGVGEGLGEDQGALLQVRCAVGPSPCRYFIIPVSMYHSRTSKLIPNCARALIEPQEEESDPRHGV